MSLFTSIMNPFGNPGPRKSSDHDDDETHVDRAPPKMKPTLGLSFSRLARIFPIGHSEASKAYAKGSKDSTDKASATDDHGEIDYQVSQTPTDSVTGHSRPSPSNQRPRALSTVSAISHQSIQSPLDTPGTDPESNRHASARSDETLDDEYDEEEEAAMAATLALFENSDPTTRSQRRAALYEMRGIENINKAANWLYDHPDDLWDTAEEQEANFTRMMLDERIETAAREDVDGLKNDAGADILRNRPDYKAMGKRAKDVGWYRALQESVLRKEWCAAEGGMFGEKGSCGPLPEEVGPMGETL
jgi:hypothetical protein